MTKEEILELSIKKIPIGWIPDSISKEIDEKDNYYVVKLSYKSESLTLIYSQNGELLKTYRNKTITDKYDRFYIEDNGHGIITYCFVKDNELVYVLGADSDELFDKDGRTYIITSIGDRCYLMDDTGNKLSYQFSDINFAIKQDIPFQYGEVTIEIEDQISYTTTVSFHGLIDITGKNVTHLYNCDSTSESIIPKNNLATEESFESELDRIQTKLNGSVISRNRELQKKSNEYIELKKAFGIQD